MSKSFLLIETPDVCCDCQFYTQSIVQPDYGHCGINHEEASQIKKLEDCPLQILPEKESGKRDFDTFDRGYTAGWNSLLCKLLENT